MVMDPSPGLKDWALVSRFRNTWARRLSMPSTISGPLSRALFSRRIRASLSVVSSCTSIRIASMAQMFTGPVSARDSSASRREASDMSLISLSRRLMSSWIMAISLRCCSGSFSRAVVSTALLRDVRGFLISCATSAAKLSMASIRIHRALVIADRLSARSPISSFLPAKSGIVC